MPKFTIQLLYVGGKEPLTGEILPTQEEFVTVEANDVQHARRLVMLHNTINPQGRLVLFFDEAGKQLFDERF